MQAGRAILFGRYSLQSRRFGSSSGRPLRLQTTSADAGSSAEYSLPSGVVPVTWPWIARTAAIACSASGTLPYVVSATYLLVRWNPRKSVLKPRCSTTACSATGWGRLQEQGADATEKIECPRAPARLHPARRTNAPRFARFRNTGLRNPGNAIPSRLDQRGSGIWGFQCR
jgi:hypothetical protein